MRIASVLTAALVLVAALPSLASEPDDGSGALAAYLANGDDSYDWHLENRGELGGTSYAQLRLTSQTWRGEDWRHQVYVLTPSNVDDDARHALLYLGGGKWRATHELGLPVPPPETVAIAAIAERLRTPVVILSHTLYQPLFDRTGNELIAYSFDQHLSSGEDDWPLLLPMVKAAVRAMDAAQDFLAQDALREIDRFTVVGASKFGWAAWLTGAMDERVAAIAPLIFNVLNMAEHIPYQREVWGEVSDELKDFEALDLTNQLDQVAGQRLLRIVDPYHYRRLLTQPKFVIVGSNDPYWPIDATDLYWDDLRGPKHLLIVPNAGHSVSSMLRYAKFIRGLVALHDQVGDGPDLPDIGWQFDQQAGRLTLQVTSDRRPRAVTAWVAEADSRDFREATWRARGFERLDRHTYVFELDIPDDGYVGLFAEISYGSGGTFSTKAKIVGPDLD
jgi:PhoPQ-activated pathogenicity-related protein